MSEGADHKNVFVGNLGPGDVALLKQVADEAAKKAVHDAFMVMGLDIDEPIISQRDFAILRELSTNVSSQEFRSDLIWVRHTRLRMEGFFGKAMLTAVGVAVAGAMHSLWLGVATLLGKN